MTESVPRAPRRWRWAASDDGEARTWFAIANDGIIATAGILEGFAGAGAGDQVLLTAAATATIAGMLSVGGAEWAEASAERDSQLRASEDEQREIQDNPEAEARELTTYYLDKGLTPEVAEEASRQLMARDPLSVQLETEYGIREIRSTASTLRAGVGAGLVHAVGALIPLLISFFFPSRMESLAIVAAVVISLTITSVLSARLGRTHLRRTLLRSLGVGLATMAISYLVGLLVL
ncbi:MAG: VIT1/CCC1 transporter family protein [Acidipropionibacterium jensenii]|uniref:VIT1/CCC1 transporter family protein n=1 Tax=Acidipropionibacterium jensenii TaxID=1749 RepID=UPI002649B81F|nr:VIT1/CCC1 transporter family protein [Acidipropionibacterium jensenii]MDN6810266.1 VIT1/CCC1 transporter family protein [Acidipropionibacterium jensenii]